MPRYRIGSVPYVNAIPLVDAFDDPETEVEVVRDVPSRLPARLDAGEVDAILVSSYYALTTPGLRAAADVGIASAAAVESVRLFARVPWREVRTLAGDASSMTSNALARIVLAEMDGVTPEVTLHPPDLDAMLAAADAAVLIGDRGMEAEPGPGVAVRDLGAAWRELTGLPFVWALWVGRERLTPELAAMLHAARHASGLGADLDRLLEELGGLDDVDEDLRRALEDPEIAAEIADVGGWAEILSSASGIREMLLSYRQELLERVQAACGWPAERVERYLVRTMEYSLEAPHHRALAEYGERLVRHGLAPAAALPAWVHP